MTATRKKKTLWRLITCKQRTKPKTMARISHLCTALYMHAYTGKVNCNYEVRAGKVRREHYTSCAVATLKLLFYAKKKKARAYLQIINSGRKKIRALDRMSSMLIFTVSEQRDRQSLCLTEQSFFVSCVLLKNVVLCWVFNNPKYCSNFSANPK